MRKELLLQEKRTLSKKLIWYAKGTISDDILKQFSLRQLQLLCEILQKADDYREHSCPFYVLSACEVLQKETGRIAYFDNSEVREESEEEVLSGASSQIYKSYQKKKQLL